MPRLTEENPGPEAAGRGGGGAGDGPQKTVGPKKTPEYLLAGCQKGAQAIDAISNLLLFPILLVLAVQ